MATSNEMLTIKAKLQFMGYRVDKMMFGLKPEFTSWPDKIALSPSFKRTIRQLDENKHEVSITVELKQDDLPFDAELSLTGGFIYEGSDSPEKMLRINAVSILYPYVRCALSMLTNLAGIPPVIIPTINFAKALEDAEASLSAEQ